jgi:hypothetical protein
VRAEGDGSVVQAGGGSGLEAGGGGIVRAEGGGEQEVVVLSETEASML